MMKGACDSEVSVASTSANWRERSQEEGGVCKSL